jgi:hypothetical protein
MRPVKTRRALKAAPATGLLRPACRPSAMGQGSPWAVPAARQPPGARAFAEAAPAASARCGCPLWRVFHRPRCTRHVVSGNKALPLPPAAAPTPTMLGGQDAAQIKARALKAPAKLPVRLGRANWPSRWPQRRVESPCAEDRARFGRLDLHDSTPTGRGQCFRKARNNLYRRVRTQMAIRRARSARRAERAAKKAGVGWQRPCVFLCRHPYKTTILQTASLISACAASHACRPCYA